MENLDNSNEHNSSFKNNAENIKESVFSINNLSNFIPKKDNTKQM